MNNEDLVFSFQKFVDSHRTYSSKDVTHKVKRKGGHQYKFKGNEYGEFLKRYAEVLKECPGTEFNFVELAPADGAGPLIIHISFLQKVAHRVYFEDHIETIIGAMNRILIQNINVTRTDLTSYVTVTPQPMEVSEHEYREEIYIYYPHLAMTEEARHYTLKALSDKITENKLLQGIPLITRPNDVIDFSICRTCEIPLFGSRIKNSDSHYLWCIYDRDCKMYDDTEDYDLQTLVTLFSTRQYDLELCTDFKDSSVEKRAKAEFRDYVYSADYNDNEDNESYESDEESYESEADVESDYDSDSDSEEYEVRTRKNSKTNKNTKAGKAAKATKKKKKDVDTVPDVRRSSQKTREINLAKRLVKIFKSKRARNMKDWQRIGYALYSVSYTMFPVFKEFSDRNRAGFDITPQDIWRAAPKHCKNYSIDTLRRWAFLDNERKYYRILKEEYSDLFEGAESCKHHDIAKVIYALYRDRFVCVDITKGKWYEFQNHKWVIVQSAYTLEALIAEDVRSMLMSYCGIKLQELAQKGKSFKDYEYKRYTKIMAGIDNLGNTDFIGKVIKACAGKFYDRDFQGKLDTDPYLVGFENGVYDLNELAFRDGMPSDMVAKTVGYDYLEFTETDSIFRDIHRFFGQVHTDSEMKEYTLTFLASIFRGKPDQKAHIWTGGGGNGKSATIDLIKRMIGDYFGVLPVTVITVKNKSSSCARPELADKYGKRFCVIQEPEHNDTVYVGQMKELTGEDTLHARPLYGDPFEYVPMFSIVLTCNNLPHIPSTDRGTWRRLRVTPYESEFVESNPVGPKQFVGDEELKERFDDWVQPLVWLLLTKYYPIYKAGVNGKRYKIKEPKLVTKYTNEYKKDSDYYIEFLDENFNFTEDPEDTETIQFVYETFSNWYSSSYGDKAPPKKKFVEYLKKNKIQHDKREIKGIAFALGLMN
jgi:Megaviricetes DNA primase